jgi:hypothetical protein
LASSSAQRLISPKFAVEKETEQALKAIIVPNSPKITFLDIFYKLNNEPSLAKRMFFVTFWARALMLRRSL